MRIAIKVTRIKIELGDSEKVDGDRGRKREREGLVEVEASNKQFAAWLIVYTNVLPHSISV